jgi:2-hydroxy-6-oxonona-2,4-dienedioate hydrolase
VSKLLWAVGAAIALAVAFAAESLSRYAADIGAARLRVSTGNRTAQTPCGSIEYAVVGDGAPLLFVHGAGGGFDQGLGIARELAEKGLRVILPSRFGYLGTPMPADPSPEAQADAHACLLDALNVEQAAVAGVSAGAPSAMQFALRHPDRTRALLLVVPAGHIPGQAASTPPATNFLFDTALRSDFVFWASIKLARETLIESVLATPPAVVRSASVDEQRRVEAVLAHILPVSARRLGLLNDARIVSTLPRYPLNRVHAPALVISVKDDGFGTWHTAADAASQLPDVRFVGYEQGGHVWVGHHLDLLQEVERFVKATANVRANAKPVDQSLGGRRAQ